MAFYVVNREVLQYGRFVRLRSPFEGDGNTTAWMSISPDRPRAVVGFYQVLNVPVPGLDRVRLRGLDPGLAYRVSVWPASDDSIARANALIRGGDDLMQAGLLITGEKEEAAVRGDFWARLFVLEATQPI